MQRVNELRCRVPAPVSGNDMLGFIYLFFVGQGSREAAEISAGLGNEIERRMAGLAQERAIRHAAGEVPPALDAPEAILQRRVDEVRGAGGAVLAMEEINHVYWPPLDPEQPFLSLARKAAVPF